MEPFVYVIIFLIIFIFLISMIGMKIVPQDYVYVVERLGVYDKLLEPGLYFIFPFIDRIAHKVSMLEHKICVKHKDKEVLLKYNITDVKLYIYGVRNVDEALTYLIKEAINCNELDKMSLQGQSEVWGFMITSLKIS
ncbi:hypothetical protein KHQ81_14340 [Mycoplasmatota bacterium]|nr:hypothetical protein KHQ81_14340 [Mycoplasmatota bacterium]